MHGRWGLVAAQEICHRHCGVTLTTVQHKGQNTQSLCARAQHISGADIAATLGADILLVYQQHQEESEGDGTQQIRHAGYDQKQRHGCIRFECSSACGYHRYPGLLVD